MSQNQRFRSGNQEIASGYIEAGVKAEIGDLVMLGSDDYVIPAAVVTVTGSGSGPGGADAPTEFKTAFFGVLIEGATGGNETEDTQCLVGHTGNYEYPLSEAADADYPPGTPLIAIQTAAPGFLQSQEVAIASVRTKAFATASRAIREGDTTVTMSIVSSIMGSPLI